MYGEGLKASLLNGDIEMLQIEQYKDTALVVYQRKDEYIKVKWRLLNHLRRKKMETINNPYFFFTQEIKGNALFLYADFIPLYRLGKTEKLTSDEYYNKEFSVDAESSLTDNFIDDLIQKGQNYLGFERYLEDKL